MGGDPFHVPVNAGLPLLGRLVILRLKIFSADAGPCLPLLLAIRVLISTNNLRFFN
jgi:hypothetical protein